MATYLWKGVDRFGSERVERVEAESAREAREKLETAGLTELRLQTDELFSAAKESVLQASAPKYHVELTPQEEVDRLGKPPAGLLESWWRDVLKNALTSLFSIGLMLTGLYLGSKWMVVLPLVGFLVFPVVFFWFRLPTQIYEQLNRAKVWHRWEEVLACCRRLERVQRWVRIGPAAWELARCRAQALAGLGRLEEGLRDFSRHETDPMLPAGMYQSFQAGIHDAARDYKRALELRASSVESMPDNMSLKIDLAMGYAQRNRDPARARAILAGVDPDLVMELARPWVQLVRGLIAMEEGDVVGAKELFKGALDGFEPFRDVTSFFSVVLLTKSYLCLAQAGAGDRLQAREMYREVAVFLESVREEELLGRIRVALAVQDP